MGTFHWVRTRMFCYATEDMERLEETMAALVGNADITSEITEGHHGNPMMLMESEMTKDREVKAMFSNLGKALIDRILGELDDRVDDDCVFHLRLDKQKAVQGMYDIGHRGDVISVTAKIVSHPARRAIAVARMGEFLGSLF